MTAFSFFDVDETLISVKSMFDILPFIEAETGRSFTATLKQEIAVMRAAGISREAVNRHFYMALEGSKLGQVIAASDAWFNHCLSDREVFFNTNIVDHLQRERAAGREPVFVSGSATLFLTPLAKELNVAHVLATELLHSGVFLTGGIRASMIGAGKAVALKAFVQKHGADPARCSAIGDHVSDLGMLECVGMPSVVAHNSDLEDIARARNWPILSPWVPVCA